MKNLKYLFAFAQLFFLGQLLAQQPVSIVLSGQIFNTNEKQVVLAQFQGNGRYLDFHTAELDKDGMFEITGQLPGKDYYVLRVGNQHINLAILNHDTLQIYGDGSNLLYFTNIIGNQDSQAMMEFFREYNNFTTIRDSVQRLAQQNPGRIQELDLAFRRDLTNFQNYRTQFISENNDSPALIAPIQSLDPQSEFQLYKSLMEKVIKAMEGSPTASALAQTLAQQNQKWEAEQFLAPGKVAPDIAMDDINGKPLKLSDLRGKYVLLDFWASWCGPCRRENPNVVAMYEKYKDKGFTVFSVSLDKTRDPWVKAIESDKLVWPYHISDLKGWSSDPAQLYKVNSIPFTLMLDPEGQVIIKNPRGPQLEQLLQSIFGF